MTNYIILKLQKQEERIVILNLYSDGILFLQIVLEG